MPTDNFSVGQGIRDKMSAAGDQPFGNSVFDIVAGHNREQCQGLLGNYRALEVTPGNWRVEGPLAVGE